MAIDAPPPEDRDVAAAEFALGLLVGAERSAAMRRLLSDTDFAQAVAAWQARLAPLYAGYASQQPPDLWPYIEARLAEHQRGPHLLRLKRRVARWRGGAIAAGIVALAAISALWFQAEQQPRPQPMPTIAPAVIAQLAGETPDGPNVVTRYFPSGSMVVRVRGMPTSDLAPELWVISADGTPRSLGLIAATGASRITVDPRFQSLIADGATLAVTMEEPATAPHAAPSSPIIASGRIAAI